MPKSDPLRQRASAARGSSKSERQQSDSDEKGRSAKRQKRKECRRVRTRPIDAQRLECAVSRRFFSSEITSLGKRRDTARSKRFATPSDLQKCDPLPPLRRGMWNSNFGLRTSFPPAICPIKHSSTGARARRNMSEAAMDRSSHALPLVVAKTSSLLYRGFPIRRRRGLQRGSIWPTVADWKSAIQQVGNLRYRGRRASARLRNHGIEICGMRQQTIQNRPTLRGQNDGPSAVRLLPPAGLIL
jgi:hypothetical protein